MTTVAAGWGQSLRRTSATRVHVALNGLYIADTNNHRITLADWATGTVRTLIAD